MQILKKYFFLLKYVEKDVLLRYTDDIYSEQEIISTKIIGIIAALTQTTTVKHTQNGSSVLHTLPVAVASPTRRRSEAGVQTPLT